MSSWLPAHWAQSAGELLSLLLGPGHWKGGSPLLWAQQMDNWTSPWLLLGLKLLPPHSEWFWTKGTSAHRHSHIPTPHSRLLLCEALLGPLLSLSTVVVFSVTSTLDGEREGESAGRGRGSEPGGASDGPPLAILAGMQTLVDSEDKDD